MKNLNSYSIDFFFLELIGILLLFQQDFKPQMVVYLLASILLAGPASGRPCSFSCPLTCGSLGAKRLFGAGR